MSWPGPSRVARRVRRRLRDRRRSPLGTSRPSIERKPAATCKGFNTGIAAMVVQLGFATIPLGIVSNAWGLTSGTTSGTSGSMRHADELSMTIAPAAASTRRQHLGRRRARRRDAISMPAKSAVCASSTTIVRRPTRASCPRTANRRSESRRREIAFAQYRAHHGPDLTGGSDDCDSHGVSLGLESSYAASRPNAVCR